MCNEKNNLSAAAEEKKTLKLDDLTQVAGGTATVESPRESELDKNSDITGDVGAYGSQGKRKP